MNKYQEMMDRQQQEFNALPLGFAFGQKQFDKMMEGWGLHPERDIGKISSIGAGGYLQKKDAELLRRTRARHQKELEAAIEEDRTGAGFIYQMFFYELANHEYGYTGDALFFFDEIKDKYHVPELTGKYKKLAGDLKDALACGLAHKGVDDGGTCNFDAPTLSLPGWKKRLVEAAARTAGVGCFEWTLWSSKSYVFPVPGVGQGYTRTRAAEAMSRYLKEHGYDAGMYYQMD